MRIINIPPNQPKTFYVIERHMKNSWRLVHLAKYMFSEEGKSIFDLVWEGDYAEFSAQGDCYGDTGIPGTYDRDVAIRAYEKLKAEISAKSHVPIRLRAVTVTVEEDVLFQTRKPRTTKKSKSAG